MRPRPRSLVLVLLGLVAACTPPDLNADGEVATDSDETTPDDLQSVAGGRETVRETLVVVESLVTGPVRKQVVVSARVQTRTSVQVFPKLSNLPVTAIHVEEGDRVEAGDVLIDLYDTELALTEASAKAVFEESKRTVAQNELRLEELEASRESSAQRSEITARELARLEVLGDLVTRKEVDEARLALVSSDGDLTNAGFALRAAEINKELSVIAQEKAHIEWERAKQNLGHSRVRAPVNGIVAMRDIEMGELSSMSAPAFRVVDTEDLILDLRVPQDVLAELAAGQLVEVTTSGAPDEVFVGAVRTVNPVLDQDTGSIHVIVDLAEAPGLVPGLFCEARIITSSRDNALLVSKRAVMYDDDQPIFFAVNGEGAAATKVAFVAGASTATQVEVLSDLDGEPVPPHLRIVVVGQENLKDGAPVKVVKEAF